MEDKINCIEFQCKRRSHTKSFIYQDKEFKKLVLGCTELNFKELRYIWEYYKNLRKNKVTPNFFDIEF